MYVCYDKDQSINIFSHQCPKKIACDFSVATARLQQQKQHLHRLQLQATAGPSVMSGCATDSASSSFGFHPASFVFNSFPALTALVAADWKNANHGP